MTGAELRAARRAAGYTRQTLAQATALHPDTVRYWERKPRLDRTGHAVTRMLTVLSLDEWHKQAVIEARAARMAARDARQGGIITYQCAGAGGRDGVLLQTEKPFVTMQAKQTCGAKTRAGHPCKSRAIYKSGRCKNHGGKSTGPRTQAGRARIAAAMRKRWADRRNETAQQAPKERSQ